MLSEFKIDILVFGSESNDINLLFNSAKIQINNPKFDSKVKDYIRKGFNYPSSLSKAIKDLTGNTVNASNDILSVSYIKEIIKNKYDIEILPIKRTNNYNDLDLDTNIVSASNVRNRFRNSEDIGRYVPKNVISCIRKIDFDMFFKLIRYKIISEKNYLKKYHLVNEGIENRIYESSLYSSDLEDFINKIKTKRYTFNKINRTLINIFIGYTKEDALKFKNLDYIKVLGLSKNGQKYYSSIKKEFSIPILTKFEKYEMLEIELKATILYSILVNDQCLISDEIKKHVILL